MFKSSGLTLCLCLFLTPAFARPLPDDATPAPPKLIKAGRILDVRTGKYLLNQAILTDGERIKEIGPWESVQAHAPKNAITIDLSQASVRCVAILAAART
jgi:hypothetical protein